MRVFIIIIIIFKTKRQDILLVALWLCIGCYRYYGRGLFYFFVYDYQWRNSIVMQNSLTRENNPQKLLNHSLNYNKTEKYCNLRVTSE